MYYLFIILFLLFIITLTITGIFLLIRSYQLKMRNLLYLGTGFIFIPIGFIGSAFIEHGWRIFFEEIFVSSGFILGTCFTNSTFHKIRKSPARLILIFVISLAIVQIIFSISKSIDKTPLIFYMSAAFDLIFTILTFNWIAWSSYSAYKRVHDKDIMPWIKFRYKIIAITSFILSLHVIPEFFTPWNMPFIDHNNFAFGITAIMAIIFGVGMFLAWIMPDSLKNYLNKGYKSLEDKEFTEEELMDMVKKELSSSD